MSFLKKLAALIPFGKKEEIVEYFFALNITHERLTAALWVIENKQLKILETAAEVYSSLDDLTSVTDKLLDTVLGIKELEPQKILFGVPSSWLSDENLKDENMKVLRGLVKELDLTPMAYVESSHALVHFLEKTDGVPPTAILVGFETHHLTVIVVRAGKIDGVKTVSRGENSGADIEKGLLTFAAVETLPSKILIHGRDIPGLKDQLLSFPWMSKLSFLHFPKIEMMQDDIEIESVCLAGASEMDGNVSLPHGLSRAAGQSHGLSDETSVKPSLKSEQPESLSKEDLGFMVGDISVSDQIPVPEEETRMVETLDFEHELPAPSSPALGVNSGTVLRFIPKKFKNIAFLAGIVGILFLTLTAYLFIPTAGVKIFVEPKILEKDTQVTADPNQKTVDEDNKIIPGQIVETDISGTAKGSATGSKEIGDPAKGTVVVRNKTDQGINISKGTILTALNGLRFTTELSASAAARSSEDGTWSKTNISVIAVVVGADSNLPSGTDLTVSGYSTDRMIAKAEGNFSGGTSKQVTVVSSDDQNKLIAQLASDLRKQAQQKLQERLPEKKILEEGLSEVIITKSFSKNINDQASEFSLNLTAKYQGTAFDDKDLKLIVSKLVTTEVPVGFQLNLEDTETQADIASLEKGGKLIFLAKFKAKMSPKVDIENVKKQIKGKGVNEALNTIKRMENILGAEIKFSPQLPNILQRLPILGRNIKIEVGLK